MQNFMAMHGLEVKLQQHLMVKFLQPCPYNGIYRQYAKIKFKEKSVLENFSNFVVN
jgi:hypothetical protein